MDRNTTSSCTKILAAAALAALAGCAIDPAPNDELARARAMLVEAAHGAAGNGAPPELALARDKIALAERWMAAGDRRPALWLVEQAQVDAELAALKAASLRARERAAAMTGALRASNYAAGRGLDSGVR